MVRTPRQSLGARLMGHAIAGMIGILIALILGYILSGGNVIR